MCSIQNGAVILNQTKKLPNWSSSAVRWPLPHILLKSPKHHDATCASQLIRRNYYVWLSGFTCWSRTTDYLMRKTQGRVRQQITEWRPASLQYLNLLNRNNRRCSYTWMDLIWANGQLIHAWTINSSFLLSYIKTTIFWLVSSLYHHPLSIFRYFRQLFGILNIL